MGRRRSVLELLACLLLAVALSIAVGLTGCDRGPEQGDDSRSAVSVSYAIGTVSEPDEEGKSFTLSRIEADNRLPGNSVVVDCSNARGAGASAPEEGSRVMVGYLIPGSEMGAVSVVAVGDGSLEDLGLSFLFDEKESV